MAKGLERLMNEYGNPPLGEAIYWGDNLKVLSKFPEKSVDLIYLDPPFSTDKKYWAIWGENDEALLEAYEEACKGGINAYVDWMRERVELMHKVLKDTGSFYFHCDPQMGHYFKVMLDDVFDYKNFQNEIIWSYHSGGASKRRFGRKHDTIFWYTKGKNYTFNDVELRVPYTESTIKAYNKEDEFGRYKLIKHKNGTIEKVYAKNLERGRILTDVWEIPHIPNWSSEKRGYATQKSKTLLKRIITASSNKGDLVLDPFCGCGTTPAVAYELNRNWVGIDIGKDGCEETKKRMQELGTSSQIIPWDLREKQIKSLKDMSGMNFQNWVLIRIGGRKRTGRDGGIDFYTSQFEPVQVKKQTVGPAVLRDFRTALQQERKQKGYIVSLSGFTKGAIEEATKYKTKENLEIELVGVKELDNVF